MAENQLNTDEVGIIPQKPKVSHSSIGIPLTFGYKGGRGQSWKGKVVAAIILTIITIFLIYLQTQGNSWWLYKILWILGYIAVYQFLIRFVIFEEHKFQKTYRELLADDMVINEKDFWGIYEIEEEYPHFVSFNNGKRGLFVKFERDVIIGQSEEDEFAHYEAIGNALQSLHLSEISITMLDTMESIGADTVLNENISNAGACENQAVREALVDIFQNLQESAKDKYTSEDTFIFASRSRDAIFLEAVEDFCKIIMDGNYKSYEFMDKDMIRNEVRNIFNLGDFSVNEAIENLYGTESGEVTSIKVLSITNYDGQEIKITKSRSEILAEQELKREKGIAREKIQAERKAAKKRKKLEARKERVRKRLVKAGKLGEVASPTENPVEGVGVDEELNLF